MNCELTRSVLHGYLDGELDAVRAAEFERHLEACHECMAELEAQEALRSKIARGNLYERAPESLRQRVREGIRAQRSGPASSRRVGWRWMLVTAAAVLIAVLTTWFVQPILRPNRSAGPTIAQVLDAHIRSLQPGHLTDVASTDQHTVRPWFEGKVDFAPPVHDFSEEGFPLVGGRLDVLNSRPVAGLVYGRRKHFINVFIWPSADAGTAYQDGSTRGYQWVRWHRGGMEYCAISEVSSADLEHIAQLLNR